MEHDLFSNLPREIAIEMFSRLPFRTVMSCKCVCKAWRLLLSTREFVGYHYTKSLPGLILAKGDREKSSRYKMVEFVESASCPLKTVYRFRVPRSATLHSSANGLLLFTKYDDNRVLFVCNPLTREYINLPPPRQCPFDIYHSYGFGASEVSGEYKVVRISFHKSLCKFEVYTLGTGSWRSLEVGGNDDEEFPFGPVDVFVDGKLYSLVSESCIRCFDLETEAFSTVSCPSSCTYPACLCALGGRLCLCVSGSDGLVVWVMDEVGQWRKEFVIREAKSLYSGEVIKVLGEGKMLLADIVGGLYYYSRNKKLKRIGIGRFNHRVGYTPSFLPLKTFATENVFSF